jgi:hypothetical protein
MSKIWIFAIVLVLILILLYFYSTMEPVITDNTIVLFDYRGPDATLKASTQGPDSAWNKVKAAYGTNSAKSGLRVMEIDGMKNVKLLDKYGVPGVPGIVLFANSKFNVFKGDIARYEEINKFIQTPF